MNHNNVNIVLVSPQGPLNIGSVARSMKNFGFYNLRLVNPETDHLSDAACNMAVKATEILKNALVFSDLGAALADIKIAVGTTRRYGKYREELIFPDTAAQEIHTCAENIKTAYVFGREDHGLTTEELDHCQRLLTIPTNNEHPSMNLAQAVTICLYELSRITHPQKEPIQEFCTGEELEEMFAHMRRTLLEIDYLDPQNPEHILRTYRRIFARNGLSEREIL
ncbi:MAG: RNA methyltransferase, partial [Proteobacteria bacterium]|nr:RNA methyltransferase [Pseudomonadota bacterium]